MINVCFRFLFMFFFLLFFLFCICSLPLSLFIIPHLVLFLLVVVHCLRLALLSLFIMIHCPSSCVVNTCYDELLCFALLLLVVIRCFSPYIIILLLHAFYKYSPHPPLCCLLWFVTLYLALMLLACWGDILPPLLTVCRF